MSFGGAMWDTKDSVKHQQQCNLPNLPIGAKSVSSKFGPKPQKKSLSTNWAAGGLGTRALFLNSSQPSSGTGVFLPMWAGNKAQYVNSDQPSSGTGVFLPMWAGNLVQYDNKTAGCLVLLPAHVLQALNLNVRESVLHMPRREGPKNHSIGRDCNWVSNRNGKDPSGQSYTLPQQQNCSPELLLPEEWTY